MFHSRLLTFKYSSNFDISYNTKMNYNRLKFTMYPFSAFNQKEQKRALRLI
jgi:hypothetical protein